MKDSAKLQITGITASGAKGYVTSLSGGAVLLQGRSDAYNRLRSEPASLSFIRHADGLDFTVEGDLLKGTGNVPAFPTIARARDPIGGDADRRDLVSLTQRGERLTLDDLRDGQAGLFGTPPTIGGIPNGECGLFNGVPVLRNGNKLHPLPRDLVDDGLSRHGKSLISMMAAGATGRLGKFDDRAIEKAVRKQPAVKMEPNTYVPGALPQSTSVHVSDVLHELASGTIPDVAQLNPWQQYMLGGVFPPRAGEAAAFDVASVQALVKNDALLADFTNNLERQLATKSTHLWIPPLQGIGGNDEL
jgi:hypothetical protein